jgi:hypothetical protein
VRQSSHLPPDVVAHDGQRRVAVDQEVVEEAHVGDGKQGRCRLKRSRGPRNEGLVVLAQRGQLQMGERASIGVLADQADLGAVRTLGLRLLALDLPSLALKAPFLNTRTSACASQTAKNIRKQRGQRTL